ncbi:unnamed protein product [Protopolystoma xenopodis]|uniref:Uncharacterized protein n=1 Tax=Protopolystoma xenopodis TaxID=117903 RepID=A0A3S5CI39_9PLAT|nr:unnamed protein product [Protopolystoma xenopodis]
MGQASFLPGSAETRACRGPFTDVYTCADKLSVAHAFAVSRGVYRPSLNTTHEDELMEVGLELRFNETRTHAAGTKADDCWHRRTMLKWGPKHK